tara:strand:+ start:44 stop:196 length:153 start_codon:yes stop_codon:yes gene_type:complete
LSALHHEGRIPKKILVFALEFLENEEKSHFWPKPDFPVTNISQTIPLGQF